MSVKQISHSQKLYNMFMVDWKESEEVESERTSCIRPGRQPVDENADAVVDSFWQNNTHRRHQYDRQALKRRHQVYTTCSPSVKRGYVLIQRCTAFSPLFVGQWRAKGGNKGTYPPKLLCIIPQKRQDNMCEKFPTGTPLWKWTKIDSGWMGLRPRFPYTSLDSSSLV